MKLTFAINPLMKSFSAILVMALAACAPAADFSTGQSARMIIGQPTFAAQKAGASEVLVGAAGGVAYAGDMLLVADANRIGPTPQNHRVLIFKNISQKFPAPTDTLSVGPRCPVCTADPTLPRPADVELGQPDFTTVLPSLTQRGLRLPTAVASDGNIVVVADTDNNRVLIWNSIPAANGAAADIVLGQDNFTTVRQPIVTDAKSFRGPQGAWIQNGRLYIADTQNHRVMIWNTIPTQSNQAADIVLGVKDFTTNPDPFIGGPSETPTNSNLLNPVSVSSDGVRLYVSDLGHNRVAIWSDINSLSTNKAFDVEVGQPDFVSAFANNSPKMCASNGVDSHNNPTYPARCAGTMNFPRFALSDGTRLFVADGGNDRILIWNQIPAASGTAADVVLGQPDMISDVNTDYSDLFTPNFVQSSSDTIRTPTSLAWDGTNLYAADPSNRRVLVYTPNPPILPPNGIRNAASLSIYAVGSVVYLGTPAVSATVAIVIGTKDTSGTPVNTVTYTYTVKQNDTLVQIVQGLTALINAGNGNPNILAIADSPANAVLLRARVSGDLGNNLAIANTLSTSSGLTGTVTSPAGGKNAARIAPGSLITVFGTGLCDCDPAYVSDVAMPRQLSGVQLYIDGIPAPLKYVSATQINAQMPYEVADTTSVTVWLRYTKKDGSVVTSSSLNVPITQQNPGVFAFPGSDPRAAIALHAFSNATALVSIDGSVKAGDIGTITIGSNPYKYTVLATDTLISIRNAFVALINASANEVVTAQASGVFTRIILESKVAGAVGTGIPITTASSSTSAGLILTALQAQTCCANQGGSLISPSNPAVPGETIIIYATGLGVPFEDAARAGAQTGVAYSGPELNGPVAFVSSLVGGRTANVLFASLIPGTVGLSKVVLQLNSSLPTDPLTQGTIAQSIYVSNIVTIPVQRGTSLTPATLTFGTVTKATTSVLSATLMNAGLSTLTAIGATVTGTNAADYTFTTTCGTTLAAGANCTYTVTFKPTITGTEAATLSVTDVEGTFNVNLTGTGQ